MPGAQRPEESVRSAGTAVPDGCDPHVGAGDQTQQVLLTAKAPLFPLYVHF